MPFDFITYLARIGGTNDGPLLPDGKNDGPLDERHLDVGQSKHRNCVSSSVPFHSSHKSANKWGGKDRVLVQSAPELSNLQHS